MTYKLSKSAEEAFTKSLYECQDAAVSRQGAMSDDLAIDLEDHIRKFFRYRLGLRCGRIHICADGDTRDKIEFFVMREGV